MSTEEILVSFLVGAARWNFLPGRYNRLKPWEHQTEYNAFCKVEYEGRQRWGWLR